MCQGANIVKSALNDAARGDRILCYVQNVVSDNQELGVDVYDGAEHIFDITDESEGGAGFRVKMKITKQDGVITNFQMWQCENDAQKEYLGQNIDGSDFTMTAKEFYSDQSSGSQQMAVTGTLNGDGEFTEKTIASDYTNEWDGGSGYGSSVIEQGFDQAVVSEWQQGTWTWTDGQNSDEGTYADRVYGITELLNTSTLSTIAVGDGAAIGVASGTCSGCGGGEYEQDFTEGWDGDTTLSYPASAFIGDLSSDQIPDLGTEPTIAFSGEEVYDCTGDSEGSLTIDQTALDQACSDLDLGYDWVNCWDIVENNN